MVPLTLNRLTTDPECIDLLNYLIKRTENVESPMRILQLAREFKEKSGAEQTETSFKHRIVRIRTGIHSFEAIDTNTKVKLMFALSASVDASFLEKLKKDAIVEFDNEKRITHYKANNGSLELRGDHSHLAKTKTTKLKSKGSYRSMINSYFEKKNDHNAVPDSEEEREMWNLIEFISEKCENGNTPLRIRQLAKDFNKHVGSSQSIDCIQSRIKGYCREIQKIEFLNNHTKVQQLFGLSATVHPDYLEKFKSEALVEVDAKNRITHYKSNDGSLELRGDHSHSAKMKTAMIESKGSLRSLIHSYFEKKSGAYAIPKNEQEKEMGNFIEFTAAKCVNVDKPLSITQLTKDFNKHFGISRSFDCIQTRIKRYCREIQKTESLDTLPKVKQLFCLSASVDSDYLKELRKNALVNVDKKNQITYYKSKNGSLVLRGDHSNSAKLKLNNRKFTRNYFENKDNVDAVPKNEEEKEMWNLIKLITEKCENVDSPLNIHQLTRDLNKLFGSSRSPDCIQHRINSYCREIQEIESLDTQTKVKQLFCLSAKLDSDFLKELRKDASVEVDDLNRVTKYTSNNGLLKLCGEHNLSAKRKLDWIERKKSKSSVRKHSNTGGQENEESENENGYSEDDSDEYSSEEFGSEFDSDDENDLDEADHTNPSNKVLGFDNETPIRNRSPTKISFDHNFDFDPPTERSHTPEETEMREDEENNTEINPIIKRRSKRSKRRYSDSEDDSVFHTKDSDDENDDLDKTQDLMEPSNKADESDNEIPVGNRSPTGMPFDNNFEYDLPTERSHISEETEMREDDEKDDPEITGNAAVKTQRSEALPKNKISSSTSHKPKTPKRKAGASAGSSSTKRTKPPSDESMNPGEMDNNCSHDDPLRIELKPFRGILGLPKGTEKDAGIQQVPKPRPQAMEAPIKKEYEEEAHTSLKMVLNAFKSLILSLDTPGLSQLRRELDTKTMEAGRRIEISNKEVIMAMELLIVKLTKIGVTKSSDDSISLREILSMLRTIFLTLKFNGFEVILEMLKVNIEQLKVEDKKVPVLKVECVLRATLDIICT